MPPRPETKSRRAGTATRQDADEHPYHHGNLVEAIVRATVELIEEKGIEAVSLREAARRAGVSPAAPFRHFPTKAALMAAVAEQAMARLTAAIEAAVAQVAGASPMTRFSALGRAYLDWALDNPTHFQVISSRTLVDVQASPSLRGQNDAIRLTMAKLLEEAREAGEIRRDLPVDEVLLSARAFGYGLARMYVDGHFPEWHPVAEPRQAIMSALTAYLTMLGVERRAPNWLDSPPEHGRT